VLELAAKSHTDSTLNKLPPLTQFIELVRGEPPVDEDVVLRVLNKIQLQDDLPKLDDIEIRLMKHLKSVEVLENTLYSVFQEIAEKLIMAVFQSASCGCDAPYKDYRAILQNPNATLVQAVLSGKKIDRIKLSQCIQPSVQTNALLSSTSGSVEALPNGFDRLEKKMTGGYIRAKDVGLMKDLKVVCRGATDRNVL